MVIVIFARCTGALAIRGGKFGVFFWFSLMTIIGKEFYGILVNEVPKLFQR